MSAALREPIIDLTSNAFEPGDIDLWIGHGKQYRDVPEFVSAELCRRMSALPAAEMLLLPSPMLPVMHLLDFPTPPITPSLKGIDAEAIFSHNKATHTSSKCLQLPSPSHKVLQMLRNTQANDGDLNSASDEPEYHPHNPKAVSSRDSERWQLLKKTTR